MKNGRIDKYIFDGGYAQASVASSTSDNFTFYYYTPDHLGNIREVVNASGSVQQVTNYYPFGATYAESTAADFQPYKYNGKELDKMHGLNTYDYGARQYDPILARWDRIDPLAEKYYNVSPYAYCSNNPIKLIDPNGKEVRDGLGAYCADNAVLKELAKNLVAHNDKNSIMIVAHGVYENEKSRFASSIDIQTYNTENKEWNHNYISNGKQLNDFLSANSKTWNKFQKGEISKEDLHIVFYSCGSSAVVREISRDKAFKDIIFIAPNRRIGVASDTSISIGDNTPQGYKEGEWHTIKNGKEPTINGNYNGNDKPGIKNFEYENTYCWF